MIRNAFPVYSLWEMLACQTDITVRARELFRHNVNKRAPSRFFVLLWRNFRLCSGWHGTAHWEASRVTDAWLDQGWVICARKQLCLLLLPWNNKEVTWMKYEVTVGVSSLVGVYQRYRIYWCLFIRLGYKIHIRRQRKPHGVTLLKRANWLSYQ
jgi:hypothetical protein